MTSLTEQIVVEQLTKNVTEDHLYEIFGKYGPIKDLKLPLNPVCKSFHTSAQQASSVLIPSRQHEPRNSLHPLRRD